MPDTKLKAKTKKPKPRLKTKNKQYTIKDSALYNLTTKRKLENILNKRISELSPLMEDSNYRVFFQEKENGKKRKIEAPKLELNFLQTRISSLLLRVALPNYVHSGAKGRSHLTNASQHIGHHPVLTMDIKGFYPSVSSKSIYYFFLNTMKASPDVAGILARVCSYNEHLPTGSRLSMPLAYWANATMYENLNCLCQKHKITMSVYVDDFTFSGKAVNKLFQYKAKKVIENAGFTVHPEKTMLYKSHEPKLITGVVIDGDEIKVRNQHHKEIHLLFNKIDKVTSDKQLETLQKKLVGKLNAAGQIDPVFKQRMQNYVKHNK